MEDFALLQSIQMERMHILQQLIIHDADSSGPFSGYKLPVFPYLIGDNFNSRPNEFNFKKASNQIDFDLNQTSFSRNTNPYNLIKNGSSYSYLELPNLLNQTADIKYAAPGSHRKNRYSFWWFWV
jgi:hypothetical protein